MLWTLVFFLLGAGLALEAVLAWRSHRVLRGRHGLVVWVLALLGLRAVLQRSLGVDYDGLRQFAASTVGLGLVVCMAVDVSNRRRVETSAAA